MRKSIHISYDMYRKSQKVYISGIICMVVNGKSKDAPTPQRIPRTYP